jgi:hypothetical protein
MNGVAKCSQVGEKGHEISLSVAACVLNLSHCQPLISRNSAQCWALCGDATAVARPPTLWMAARQGLGRIDALLLSTLLFVAVELRWTRGTV